MIEAVFFLMSKGLPRLKKEGYVMKKTSKKLTKVSAVLVTALMAASAVGMTTSATEMKKTEALRPSRTTKSASKTSKRSKGGLTEKEALTGSNQQATISLIGKDAKPGENVSVEMVMNTNNLCSCYDVLVEYDARLDFESAVGAQATCDFEDGGRKFISLVGYSTETFKDGETVVTINFKVPEMAENDDYEVKFSEIKDFSTDVANFEDYKSNDTVITVTGGVEKREGNTLKLVGTRGVAGDSAVVQLVPVTGNTCVAYDILVEYDSRLFIEDCDVAGANAFCIFEEGGKSYVSLVGYTTELFADGQAMAALNFHLPYDAYDGEEYEVNIVEVKDYASSSASYEEYETKNGKISVYESARPNDVFKEYKVFKKFGPTGALMGSAVGMRGDANNDGKADVRDAAAAANHCAKNGGVDEMGQFFADVDDNGKMDVRDAAKIARYVATGRVSWDRINGK